MNGNTVFALLLGLSSLSTLTVREKTVTLPLLYSNEAIHNINCGINNCETCITSNDVTGIKDYHLPHNAQLFSAHLKNGKLHHKFWSRYPNGQLIDSGTFKNGIPDGEWKRWNKEGKLIQVRNYCYNRYSRILGEINNQVKHPYFPLSKLAKKDKQKALSFFKPVYHYQPHLSLKERVLHNANQSENYTSLYEKALLNGQYTTYSSEGSLLEDGVYKSGMREGVWVTWDTEQKLNGRGFYKNGNKHKDWRYYNKKGQLVKIADYRNGVEVYSKQFAAS